LPLTPQCKLPVAAGAGQISKHLQMFFLLIRVSWFPPHDLINYLNVSTIWLTLGFEMVFHFVSSV
jgi:hypothetical protein